MNTIFDMLNPDNTIAVNRPLAHAIGLNEAMIYASLASKQHYYAERGMLDEDGWFYCTVDDMFESTALSKFQQCAAVKNLKAVGLVDCAKKGMPARRYFKVSEDTELLARLMKEGEARLRKLYPLTNEAKRPTAEPGGPDGTEEVPSTSGRETEQQAAGKLYRRTEGNRTASGEETLSHTYKSKIKNQKINKSIYPASREAEDRIEPAEVPENDRELVISRIREAVEYDFLYENRDNRVLKIDMSKVDSFVEIMADVLCSGARTVRVNGSDIPLENVERRFLSLTEEHIRYVIDVLERNAPDVKNIRAYLITALYNAPATIDSYYAAMYERDRLEGRI